MTTPVPPTLLQHLWKSALVSGLLALALGVAIVAWPAISITVAAIFFGAGLLVTGIQQVFFAFSLHVSAGGRVLLFISGAASLILAILAFRHLYDAFLLLAIWIGIGFIFRGVATTASAISDPTLPGRAWNIFVGVISLIAGIVIMASPFESLATLALVVGIWLIVIGVMEIVAAYGIYKGGKDAMQANAPTGAHEEIIQPTVEPTDTTADLTKAESTKADSTKADSTKEGKEAGA